MEDYKQYLSDDPDEREKDAARQVMEGLAGLRLESKVAEVAAQRRAWLQRRFWRRAVWGTVFVIIAGAVFFVFKGEDQEGTPPAAPPVLQQPMANETPPVKELQTPTEAEKKQPNSPIAKNETTGRLPSPRFPAPNIRGQNTEDKAWKAVLDQVWYTEYPIPGLGLSGAFDKADQSLKTRDFSTAYVQLQRLERKLSENDTLRLLKGYCLLEMGEGAEAYQYLDGLDQRHPAWAMHLDWYRGLALMLQGNKQGAEQILGKIASSPGHTYRQQAGRARQLLK